MFGNLRERRETDRGPAVIGEDHEGRTGCAENAMITNAVHDRAHSVFTNAKVNIAAHADCLA